MAKTLSWMERQQQSFAPTLSETDATPILSSRFLFVREDGNSSWGFLISGKGCALNTPLISISHTQPTHPRFQPSVRVPLRTSTRVSIGGDSAACTMRTATVHA